MELLRGATLRDFLKQSDAAPIARKLDLMNQLCAGLASAHNASIYHRDIKPGNVFVRSDGILKILDFGVARLATSSMTAAGFIVGTPDYMSPEQARGAEIDGRSDIFSLGGVCYFMLTGRKPFPAADLPSLFRQIQSDDPAPLLETEAPADVAALVMKALAKQPAARYQSCQDILADLEVLRQRYPLTTRGRSPLPVSESVPAAVVVADPPRTAPLSPSTDDTVDSLPFGALSSDDTVTIAPPPSLVRRLTGRVDSAVSGAFGRLWRTSPPGPTRPTGMRKG